jgi:hypothetical protein
VMIEQPAPIGRRKSSQQQILGRCAVGKCHVQTQSAMAENDWNVQRDGSFLAPLCAATLRLSSAAGRWTPGP